MADASEIITIIGPDTTIIGEMKFDKTARIQGSFEGKITAGGELQIGAGATCKADVSANKVQCDGVIEGDVTAREHLELAAKARIQGDIVAAKLVVSEGASFVGHCKIGPDAFKDNGASGSVESKPQAKPAAQASQPAKK
ncbi:MAG: polymer-forming cytoskeletal protein [Phycisphaerales bacterium]|nr:polymer-forming cytoskeletal protein [Phycisphaerales bacterium]